MERRFCGDEASFFTCAFEAGRTLLRSVNDSLTNFLVVEIVSACVRVRCVRF
jgi:hypothetical protein